MSILKGFQLWPNAPCGQPLCDTRRTSRQRRRVHLLEPLGLGTTGEEVYRALLGEPDSSARELAERTGLTLARVREDLAHLVSLRLAQRNEGRPARFRTAPPDIAITALVNERQAGLDRA